MKLVCDEGIERQVVERLRKDGYDVVYVAEEMEAAPDEEVLARAVAEDAVLVTADKDFGELIFRQGRLSSGVLLLRLAGIPNHQKADLVSSLMRLHGTELTGAFAVATPDRLRIRRSAP